MVEIKSIELAPFTLITSSVQAIIAFILAVLTLIFFAIAGAVIPQFGAAIVLIGVAAIIVYPVSAYFLGIMVNFFSAYLYNGLVPRLGGVKLELEGNTLTEIPVVPFALILAVVETIWAFILGLVLAAASAPLLGLLSSSAPEISQILTNITTAANATGAAIPTGSAIGGIGIIGAIALIIGLPIVVFIGGFIGHALMAIFYNYIAIRVSKIQLEFEKVSDTLHELKTVPVVPAALSIAVVFTIFGIIQGIVSLIQNSAAGNVAAGVGSLIGQIVGNFIVYFILVALAAWFYNYLVPRMGGIKLDLE